MSKDMGKKRQAQSEKDMRRRERDAERLDREIDRLNRRGMNADRKLEKLLREKRKK